MGMDLGVRAGVERLATAAQIDPNELVRSWVTKAMLLADLNAAELSRKSGVPRETIDNIIHHKHKNGCRIDVVVNLLFYCGFTFQDFESVVRPRY